MAENHVTCPACGLEERVDAPTTEQRTVYAAVALQDIAVFRCDVCDSRYVYGKLVPKVVIEPFEDDRGMNWIRLRFQNAKTREDLYSVDLDPRWAFETAKSVISLIKT